LFECASSFKIGRIARPSVSSDKSGRFKKRILMGIKEFGFELIITNFRYFRGFGWFLLRSFRSSQAD